MIDQVSIFCVIFRLCSVIFKTSTQQANTTKILNKLIITSSKKYTTHVFIAMQESSYLLEEDIASRLTDIKNQQSYQDGTTQIGQDIKDAFKQVQNLIKNTPIERKELDKTDLWARSGMEEKLQEYRRATKNQAQVDNADEYDLN